MVTKWADIAVVDAAGHSDSLGEIVNHSPELLDTASIENGAIQEWPDFYVEGQEITNGIPDVDWDGFEETLYPTP
jgi:hypothetical protein